MMTSILSRRDLFKSGFVLGFSTVVAELTVAPTLVLAQEAAPPPAPITPNAFIKIGTDGSITFILPNVEMGQGIHTGEATLIAEELEVELSQVAIVDAPPDTALYVNSFLHMQQTGGSTSIRANWDRLRQAGAAARGMLVNAAAQGWGVQTTDCKVAKGVITHIASGRSVAYGAVAEAAAKQPIPQSVALKPVSEFTMIGKSLPRVDTPAKANGTAVFGIDAKVPGMKFAAVKACPVNHGKMIGFDDSRAKTVQGYVTTVRSDDWVAVIADNYWAAQKGIDALDIDWDFGDGNFNTDTLWQELRTVHEKKQPVELKRVGDPEGQYNSAATKISVEYQSPFLAHATMEPINCTAHVRGDVCELWVGTQTPVEARDAAAQAAGVSPDKVILNNHIIGGGFGRRLYVESITQAVKIAKQVSYPVKMVWSREEDIRQDLYKPAYYDRLQAGLDAYGNIVSWQQHIAAGSVLGQNNQLPPDGKDPNVGEGSIDTHYEMPNLLVDWNRVDPPVKLGWWRGVGALHNTYVNESFLDEIAVATTTDPLDLRRKLLSKTPRALACIDLLQQKSGWGSALPAGHGRGFVFHSNFGSYMAASLEIAVSDEGLISLKKAVFAVDVGVMINPDTLNAQIEGGLIFGLSAALYSSITFANGQTQQSNLNDYRILRFYEKPAIEIHHVVSTESPGGIGEAATAASIALLGNAIFAATGKRLRQFPFTKDNLKSAT